MLCNTGEAVCSNWRRFATVIDELNLFRLCIMISESSGNNYSEENVDVRVADSGDICLVKSCDAFM